MISIVPKDVSKVNTVVMFHDDCADGFGAAWLWREIYNLSDETTAYIPCNYNHWLGFQALELLKPSVKVAILDFSFTKARIKEIAAMVYPGRVELLDHHKTALQELVWDEDEKPYRLTQVIPADNQKSGVGLVLSYLGEISYWQETNWPLALYIQDRDLWKFELPDSKAINEVIQITPKTFKAYGHLNVRLANPKSRNDVAVAGHALLWQKEIHLDYLLTLARPCKLTIGEEVFEGLAVNGPEFYASDLGNLLAEKSGTYGLVYGHKKDGSAKVNLRSKGDYDVSKLAKAFGGGGHKNAAGFVMTEPTMSGEVCFFTGAKDV